MRFFGTDQGSHAHLEQLVLGNKFSPLKSPSTYVGTFEGTDTPHAMTSRVSYTVPSGYKLHVSAISFDSYRTVIATANNLQEAQAELNIASGGLQQFWRKAFNLTAIGSLAHDDLNLDVTLNAGDIIQLSTQDAATGGTIWYAFAFTGTLYLA